MLDELLAEDLAVLDPFEAVERAYHHGVSAGELPLVDVTTGPGAHGLTGALYVPDGWCVAA